MSDQTRGERNNNPGNIDRSNILWKGMAQDQSDPRFIVFETPELGIRALAKVLLSYYQNHSLNTVREIINRWAPNTENDTSAYVYHVAKMVGVNPDDAIDLTDQETLADLTTAIIEHENGRVIYDQSTIMASVQDALA